MLVVKTNKVKVFDLTPFSAFTCVKPNEQSLGLIMTIDAFPRESWLSLLIRLNRISEIFAGCAVEKGCPQYLDLSYNIREPVNLQGLKRHIVKRQTDKIMTSSDGHSLLTPSYHRQQQQTIVQLCKQQPCGGPTWQTIAHGGDSDLRCS